MTTTTAPLAPTALLVHDPVLEMADASDREGVESHDDFAWMECFARRHELTGEFGERCNTRLGSYRGADIEALCTAG